MSGCEASTGQPGEYGIGMATTVPVLTYHSLDTSGSVISISPSLFRSQMLCLRSRGWRTLTLDQFLGGFTGQGWPRKALLLTFDDAYESFAAHAIPVLQSTGFTAILFVVAGRVGQNNGWAGQPAGIPRGRLLDWPALKAIAGSGFEIGAHTLNHPQISALSDLRMNEEVLCSKDVIEDHIGRDVRAFAYPYGDSTPACESVVARYFLAGFGTRLSVVGQNSRRTAFERIDTYYLRNRLWFSALGTDWFEPYLRFRRAAKSMRTSILRSGKWKWRKNC